MNLLKKILLVPFKILLLIIFLILKYGKYILFTISVLLITGSAYLTISNFFQKHYGLSYIYLISTTIFTYVFLVLDILNSSQRYIEKTFFPYNGFRYTLLLILEYIAIFLFVFTVIGDLNPLLNDNHTINYKNLTSNVLTSTGFLNLYILAINTFSKVNDSFKLQQAKFILEIINTIEKTDLANIYKRKSLISKLNLEHNRRIGTQDLDKQYLSIIAKIIQLVSGVEDKLVRKQLSNYLVEIQKKANTDISIYSSWKRNLISIRIYDWLSLARPLRMVAKLYNPYDFSLKPFSEINLKYFSINYGQETKKQKESTYMLSSRSVDLKTKKAHAIRKRKGNKKLID